MSEEKSWEESLRSSDISRRSNELRYDGRDLGRRKKSFPGNASTIRNVESYDYDPKLFFKKTGVDDSCIIADPFKPTLNKWIKKEEKKDEMKKM